MKTEMVQFGGLPVGVRLVPENKDEKVVLQAMHGAPMVYVDSEEEGFLAPTLPWSIDRKPTVISIEEHP